LHWHSTVNLNISADLCINNGNDFTTLCTNLVANFGPVTPKMTRLKCVQQASQQVSLTLIARQQHCYTRFRSVFFFVLLFFTRGLHASICHVFLVLFDVQLAFKMHIWWHTVLYLILCLNEYSCCPV